MTLRQLLTHTEKSTRDLIEHFQSTVLAAVADFRDLSRPIRRKSHFPTLLALMNALNKLQHVSKETQGISDYLLERLQEIREHTKKDRIGRS